MRHEPPDPVTPAYMTTSGGEPQAVRLHLAQADGGIHAVLQYRGAGEREWHSALQTVCGLRKFALGVTAGFVCEMCHAVWEANK